MKKKSTKIILLENDTICFKAKWGNKYVWPKDYEGVFYKKSQKKEVIAEKEMECPYFKGKIHVFQMQMAYIKI